MHRTAVMRSLWQTHGLRRSCLFNWFVEQNVHGVEWQDHGNIHGKGLFWQKSVGGLRTIRKQWELICWLPPKTLAWLMRSNFMVRASISHKLRLFPCASLWNRSIWPNLQPSSPTPCFCFCLRGLGSINDTQATGPQGQRWRLMAQMNQ